MREEVLELLDTASLDLGRGLSGQLGAADVRDGAEQLAADALVVVEQLLAVERHQALEHTVADATGADLRFFIKINHQSQATDRADNFRFQIVRVACAEPVRSKF